MTDPKRLTRAVSNLVENAALFTETGGTIHVSLQKTDGLAVLRVRDSGRGLRPEDLERIFEPFVQGPEASSGLGLGLAFVRKVAEYSGGRAYAHSEGPGRGSEFVVELPLHGS
jgi:signal transduction histidine kinase